jgi:hypothetical protein
MERYKAEQSGDSRIKVCKLRFWDGTKYILNCDKEGWRALRDEAINRKQPKFHRVKANGELPESAGMVHIHYQSMELERYNKLHASPDLSELHEAVLGNDNGK